MDAAPDPRAVLLETLDLAGRLAALAKLLLDDVALHVRAAGRVLLDLGGGHRLAQELAGLVPEHPIELRIRVHDRAVGDAYEADALRHAADQHRVEPQVAVGPLAVGEVTDGGGHDQAVGCLQRREPDLGRELRSVLSHGEELASDAHAPRVGAAAIRRALGGVRRPRSLGHEQLDGLPQELAALVAEEPFGLRIHEQDPPAVVDDHHRVGRRLEQAAEGRLGRAERRLVGRVRL